MPTTYCISNNNTNNYYWESRVQEQCSLTTSCHGDFTQEMSIKREIEGQIYSLWGEKQTEVRRGSEKRQFSSLKTRGFKSVGKYGKKTQRHPVCCTLSLIIQSRNLKQIRLNSSSTFLLSSLGEFSSGRHYRCRRNKVFFCFLFSPLLGSQIQHRSCSSCFIEWMCGTSLPV